jgi:hypothetical protein
MPEGAVLVTGANRGIGAAIAAELAAAGRRVAGLTRSGRSAAGDGFVCDVSEESSIAQAVAAVAAHGPIAGLVNNAGLYEAHVSAELAATDFERIMRVNATAVVVAARQVYPHLKRAGGGLIVNIGSYYDKLGVANTVAYCASQGRGRRHHPVSGRGMGTRQYPRHRRGPRLYRHRTQRQIPRPGGHAALDQTANSGWPGRHARGNRQARGPASSALTSPI